MRWVIPALCGVVFTLYKAGTLSASVPRWCVLYGIFLIGSLWLVSNVRKPLPEDSGDQLKVDLIDGAVWAFVLLSAESLLWSGDWRAGIYSLANMAALAGLFCMVRRLPAENFHLAVWLGVIVGLGMLIQWPLDTGGYGNRNFAAEFMVISIPLVLGARCALLRRGLSWLLPRLATWFFSTNRRLSLWLLRRSHCGARGPDLDFLPWPQDSAEYWFSGEPSRSRPMRDLNSGTTASRRGGTNLSSAGG